jgi:hypothetical protein
MFGAAQVGPLENRMNQNVNNALAGARNVHHKMMMASPKWQRNLALAPRPSIGVPTELLLNPEPLVVPRETGAGAEATSPVSLGKALRTYYSYADGVVSQRKRDSPLFATCRASSTDEARRILIGGE